MTWKRKPIELKDQNTEKSKQEKASLPVLPPTKKQEMSDIKSLLAKRIKAKQKQISESENRVNRQ